MVDETYERVAGRATGGTRSCMIADEGAIYILGTIVEQIRSGHRIVGNLAIALNEIARADPRS